jgi:hypothetical protein
MSGMPDTDFGDLDDLLNPPPAADNPFADLEQFLDEHAQEAADRGQYEADINLRKRGWPGMSQEEIAFINSRMEAFEARRIWRPERNIAVFAKYVCACGQDKLVFTRWMQYQQSRVNALSRRWVALTKPPAKGKLPESAAYEVRNVPMCPVCAVAERDIDTHGMQELQEVFK